MEELENFEEWEESSKGWPYKGEVKKKVVDRWSETGILEGFDEDIQEDMALSMETTACMVLNEMGTKLGDNRFDTCIFAIMGRVLRALPNLMTHENVRNLYMTIKVHFMAHQHLIAEISVTGADGEAEVCALVAEKIIKIYQGD